MTAMKFAVGATALALLSVTIAADPLACQVNQSTQPIPLPTPRHFPHFFRAKLPLEAACGVV